MNNKGLFRGPVFWCSTLIVLLAGGIIGWGLYHGIYPSTPPRFESILVMVNNEPRQVLSGETFPLHPSDIVKIHKIYTNVLFNTGIRLTARGFDVGALQYEAMPLAALLSEKEVFNHNEFTIQIKYLNKELGYMVWDVRPYEEDWLEQADKIKDDDDRLALLKRGLTVAPGDQRIWRRLLDEYKKQKHWKEAAAMLENKAAEKTDRDVLFELLEVYTAMGSEDKITSVLKRLIQQDPKDLRSRSQLAELYEKRGYQKSAISEYEALLDWLNQRDRPPIYKHLGYLYTETGQFEKAISSYLNAEKQDKNDANLYYNLSSLYAKLNNKDKADVYLAKAVALKSEDVDSRLTLAKRLVEKGEIKEAEAYLSEILKKDPESIDALVLLAQIREKQGKKEALLKLYDKILSLDPNNETVLYNLGALEYDAGNLKKSASYFTKYLKQQPDDEAVHRIMFDIYKKQNNSQMAFSEAKFLVSRYPKELGLYDFIFEHLNATAHYTQMIPIMEAGIAANPKQFSLREYLTLAYLKTGKENKAVKQLEEIVKYRPKDIDLWLRLARLQEKLGDYKEALKSYKRVTALSPGHEEAGDAYIRLRLKGMQGE